MIGGSAVPRAMIEDILGGLWRRGLPRLGHDRDEPARHVGTLKPEYAALPAEAELDMKQKAGLHAVRRRDEDRRR